MVQPQPRQDTQVSFPDHLKGGIYSNKVVVTHTKENFVIDFMIVASATSTVTSRVIITPAHMKRIVTQLHDDVVKYQGEFERISPSEEPQK
jgi:hypothetical protein